MARKSHKGYWYIPIEYIKGLAKLQETIRMMQNESKIHKKTNENI